MYRLLVARQGLDPKVVYTLTQILFEHRASLVAYSSLAGLIRPLADDGSIPIPLHEGARRYYDREKPGLVQENSRILASGLYIAALFTSLVVALRGRLKRARRIRITDYTDELMQVVNHARTAQRTADLQELREQLVDILQRVVSDLDADRVTREEFDHFSFTWQAADRIVHDYIQITQAAEVSP